MEGIRTRFTSGPHPEQPEGFKYFSKNELADIYEFSKELTKYLENEHVKNVLFLDRSARPAWVGVDEYWNQNYKDEEKPGFYFANPDGMEARSEGYITDFKEILNLFEQLMDKGSLPQDKSHSIKELAARFKEVYPKLTNDLTDPLVVFDTCSHTGDTMKNVLKLLEEVGFQDVRPITATRPDWNSDVEPAAIIDHEVRLDSCYPFGKFNLVGKTGDVVSAPNRENLDLATNIRQDIRKVVRQGGI